MTHHPSDAMLTAYAAGTLGEGLSLVVATHIGQCAQCCRAVDQAEAVGGVLLDDVTPADVDTSALDRLLDSLDDLAPEPVAPVRRAPVILGDIVLPEPMASWLKGPVTENRWSFVAPGIRQIEVLSRREGHGQTVKLVRLAPGTAIPDHGHHGSELTMVLSGAFSDGAGRYGPGDVAEADNETQHRPVADAGAECICIIATDARLRFDGVVARLVQKLTGF